MRRNKGQNQSQIKQAMCIRRRRRIKVAAVVIAIGLESFEMLTGTTAEASRE